MRALGLELVVSDCEVLVVLGVLYVSLCEGLDMGVGHTGDTVTFSVSGGGRHCNLYLDMRK